MKWLVAGLVAAAALVELGCITDFPQPLVPAAEGVIEPQLTRAWRCVGAEDPVPVLLTFVEFDETQFLVTASAGGEEPAQHRAHASRVGGVAFLSVQSIHPTREKGWTILEYSFTKGDGLRLRAVNPQPFEEVSEDPEGVRNLLERNVDNEEFFVPALECAPARDGESGPADEKESDVPEG